MKSYITRFLKTVAAFFLAFPVTYIILAATLFDIPLSKGLGILLSPFYWLVSLCAVVVGYGFWEMRRWSWYAFVLLQVVVCYENAVLVHGYAESHHKVLAFVIAVLFQLILSLRVAKEIRVPYFFPKIRWWESNPQFRFSAPVSIAPASEGKSEEIREGEILDLSVAGCFIKVRSDFVQDQSVALNFSVFGNVIHCDGKIVWCAQSSVTHPRGIGVKFIGLAKNQKRSLRRVSKKLKKVASFLSKLAISNEPRRIFETSAIN